MLKSNFVLILLSITVVVLCRFDDYVTFKRIRGDMQYITVRNRTSIFGCKQDSAYHKTDLRGFEFAEDWISIPFEECVGDINALAISADGTLYHLITGLDIRYWDWGLGTSVATGGGATQIDVCSGGKKLVSTNSGYDVWKWDPDWNTGSNLGTDIREVQCSDDMSHIIGLNKNTDHVYRWDSGTTWNLVSDTMTMDEIEVAMHPQTSELYIFGRKSNQFYYLVYPSNLWNPITTLGLPQYPISNVTAFVVAEDGTIAVLMDPPINAGTTEYRIYAGDLFSNQCWGISEQLETVVCSGHGECSNTDLCDCEEGYYGTECRKEGLEYLYGHPTIGNYAGAPNYPASRRHFAIFKDGRNELGFYLTGGFVSFNDLWYFDSTTNQFQNIIAHTGAIGGSTDYFDRLNQPAPSHGMGYVSTNNSGIIYNGCVTNRGMMWEFSFDLEMWRLIRNDASSGMSAGTPGEFGGSVYPSSKNCVPGMAYLEDRHSFLLFGGSNEGINGEYGSSGMMNDLWEYSFDLGQFRFIKGSRDIGSTSVKDTDPMVFGTGNLPPYFYNEPMWLHKSSERWYAYATNFDVGNAAEMWIFDIKNENWTYSEFPNPSGGGPREQFVFDPLNCPGARYKAGFWANGDYLYVVGSWEEDYGDIFVYSTTLNQFAFAGGRLEYVGYSDTENDMIGSVGAADAVYLRNSGYFFAGYGTNDEDPIDLLDFVFRFYGFYCNGTIFNLTNLCNGHGECSESSSESDYCSCDIGYFGQLCELWECNNVVYNSDQVCGGNGECFPSGCECYDNFMGDDCELEVKYHQDVWFFDGFMLSCSGNGNIVDGECECYDNYYGSDCGVVSCGNIFSNSSSVCSEAGLCVGHDECVCSMNAEHGAELFCSPFDCFGYNNVETPETVCGGNGVCVGNSTCECDFGFHGFDCSESYWEKKIGDANLTEPIHDCGASATPGSRESAGQLVDDLSSRFWLFGGKGGLDFGCFNDLFYYRIFENSWCYVKGSNYTNSSEYYEEMFVFGDANVPSGRYSHSLFGLMHILPSLFVFGGKVEYEGDSATNDVWEYGIIENQWRILQFFSSDPMFLQPKPRFSHILVTEGSMSYIFGGSDGSEGMFNDLWSYNVIENTFELMKGNNTSYNTNQVQFSYSNYVKNKFDDTYIPLPRSGGNGWISDGNIYVFGGEELYNGAEGYTNTLFQYNVSLGSWSWINGNPDIGMNLTSSIVEPFEYNVANSPHGRAGAIHWNIGEELFFYGGEYSEMYVFADLWSYSISQNSWMFVNGTLDENYSASEVFAGARSFASASVVSKSQQVVIFGGRNYR